MVAKEAVKSRMETGISFTEFSYVLIQAYDFLQINEKYDCELEVGGSDQWGNITAGIELVRKTKGKEVFGLTLPLVTTLDGKKFGKSEGNAVWLDAGMTSPYHFYQFWLNADDKDAVKFLKCYTFLSLEEIRELEEKTKTAPEKEKPRKLWQKRLRFSSTAMWLSKTPKNFRESFRRENKRFKRTRFRTDFQRFFR